MGSLTEGPDRSLPEVYRSQPERERFPLFFDQSITTQEMGGSFGRRTLTERYPKRRLHKSSKRAMLDT
jgi:hypothetical protein